MSRFRESLITHTITLNSWLWWTSELWSIIFQLTVSLILLIVPGRTVHWRIFFIFLLFSFMITGLNESHPSVCFRWRIFALTLFNSPFVHKVICHSEQQCSRGSEYQFLTKLCVRRQKPFSCIYILQMMLRRIISDNAYRFIKDRKNLFLCCWDWRSSFSQFSDVMRLHILSRCKADFSGENTLKC